MAMNQESSIRINHVESIRAPRTRRDLWGASGLMQAEGGIHLALIGNSFQPWYLLRLNRRRNSFRDSYFRRVFAPLSSFLIYFPTA
jgi:hypothetical protein